MNTSLSTMTTEQLIEACADEGIVVSVTQLGRWVREGLIPASLRRWHGRGRGMGAEWLWEAECLPRVKIIARTLAAGDPSFQRAAWVLAAAGYAPTASRLRMVLLDRLAFYEQHMTKRQTYLTKNYSQAEKQKRLTKHMRRKVADMPDSAFQPFIAYTGALFGVISPGDPNASDVIKQFQQVFSFPAWRQRLEAIDDPTLLEKYEEAGRFLPSLVPIVLGGFDLLLLPLLRQLLKRLGQDTSTLPTSINPEVILENMHLEAGDTLITSNQMIGELRLFFTIFLITIPTENTAFLTRCNRILWDIISQVLDYFGVSPEPMLSLIESADALRVRPLP